MSNGAKITLTVVLLVVAGSLYFLRTGNANDLTENREYGALLKCGDCSTEFRQQLDVAARGPFKCEKCGHAAAWFVWKCSSCGTQFVPPASGDPPLQPVIPTCPKCKGNSAGRMSS